MALSQRSTSFERMISDLNAVNEDQKSAQEPAGIGLSAMTVSLSREFLLMSACSSWPPSDHRTGAIRAAAAEPLDWSLFERIVTRHRVVGLAYQGLRTAGVQVPALTLQGLGNRATALVRAGLV